MLYYSTNPFLQEAETGDVIEKLDISNNTIDHLLQLACSCWEVALLGPSTPLLREPFVDTPVTCISGIRMLLWPERVLQIVSKGGGFRDVKMYYQNVNVIISNK